ncbi:MAG: hypothetical protein M0019_11350 [Actinomycetota bacterium]|nr:hypothetical protein [Actinomycetota bacterium]
MSDTGDKGAGPSSTSFDHSSSTTYSSKTSVVTNRQSSSSLSTSTTTNISPSTNTALFSPVLVSGVGWSSDTGIGGVLHHSCSAVGGDTPKALPDRACTPGAIDVNISQANLSSTICSYGYTESLRPPYFLTEPVKYSLMKSYGYEGLELHSFELDHLIPLELGGASTYQNLWPELNNYPAPGYLNSKDIVENRLHLAVCDGVVSLAAAQSAIARDWITALQILGLS